MSGILSLAPQGKRCLSGSDCGGKASIVDRLITEGTGITVVVLDTKAILEERQTTEMIPPAAESNGGSGGHKDLIVESESAFSRMTVLIWKKRIEKEEVIRRLLDSFREVGKELMESAWESVIDREKQGGTFVGEDVAIPHARIAGLSQPLMAIGVGKEGILDQEAERKFRLMILLLSPLEPPESHLKMLGLISRMARDDQWRRKIISASKSADIINAINEWIS